MGDGVWDSIKGTVAKAAPLLGSMLGGPAGGTAGTLIAEALGTDESPDAISQALQDPEAAAKLKAAEQENRAELKRMKIEADSNRLAEINKTIRAEQQSDNWYRAGWRPTFGYAAAIAFAIQMIGITVVLGMVAIGGPGSVGENASNAGDVIGKLAEAVSALMPLWGIALSVLGISIRQRSRDKETQAGQQQPMGMLAGLAKRIAGGDKGG